MGVLPVSFQLNGRKISNINQLSWNNPNETGLARYEIERKQGNETKYSLIGTVLKQNGNYFFNDNKFGEGVVQYRLKIVYANKIEYSNVITLKLNSNEIVVYPNPVNNEFRISLSSQRPTDYKIELFSSNGQLLMVSEAKNVSSTTLIYPRSDKIKPGIYLLRITDITIRRTEIRKLVFE